MCKEYFKGWLNRRRLKKIERIEKSIKRKELWVCNVKKFIKEDKKKVKQLWKKINV